MADTNHSKGLKTFQGSTEEIIAELQKRQAEREIKGAKKIPENDLYEQSQAEIRRLEAISKAKQWMRYVQENAREGESLEEADERLRKEIKSRRTLEHAGITAYPVKLPQWPESKYGLPNGMLRSALFSAIRKGRRKFLNEVELAAINGVQVIYKGEQLDQSDLDVYESVLHALRTQEMGERHKITAYSLFKIMGKKNTGGNRKVLLSSLLRLKANAVVLRQGKYTYIGSLLDWALKNEDTKEWIIELNSTIRVLYEPDQFTLIDWEVRKALNGQPLAQWLHGFYASHADPHPIRIETLLKLAGSEDKNLFSAKQTLKKALDAVVEAFKKVGQDFKYVIHNGAVYVKKQPSKSQQRHLGRRKCNR